VQGNDATDGTPNSLGSGAALCATGGAYNTTGVTATTPLCGLQIRTSF